MNFFWLRYRIASLFRFPKALFVIRWTLRVLLLVLIMDTGYLVGIWPDWELYTEGPVQRSNFIRSYIFQQYRNKPWPKLRWHPVSVDKISRHMIRAIIVAEDSRFYSHAGLDLDALKQAMEYNLSAQRFVYGGSTISQQTVKNIFLSASRDPLRKWHEFVLTLGMEQNLSKRRILELYLNVAEFGRGVYGVEAAARFYWGVSAAGLSVRQAIELAATLPAPVTNNPTNRTRFFKNRVKKIYRYF